MSCKIDFSVTNCGSLFLVHPLTKAARAWLDETAPEDAQFMGTAMAVEPRYLEGVREAAREAGFSIS